MQPVRSPPQPLASAFGAYPFFWFPRVPVDAGYLWVVSLEALLYENSVRHKSLDQLSCWYCRYCKSRDTAQGSDSSVWSGCYLLGNVQRKSFANLGDIILLWVRMKMHCFNRWLTTTRMVMNPKDGGSCSMKSIEMEIYGFLGMRSCFNKPKGLSLGTFAWMQVV